MYVCLDTITLFAKLIEYVFNPLYLFLLPSGTVILSLSAGVTFFESTAVNETVNIKTQHRIRKIVPRKMRAVLPIERLFIFF